MTTINTRRCTEIQDGKRTIFICASSPYWDSGGVEFKQIQPIDTHQMQVWPGFLGFVSCCCPRARLGCDKDGNMSGWGVATNKQGVREIVDKKREYIFCRLASTKTASISEIAANTRYIDVSRQRGQWRASV